MPRAKSLAPAAPTPAVPAPPMPAAPAPHAAPVSGERKHRSTASKPQRTKRVVAHAGRLVVLVALSLLLPADIPVVCIASLCEFVLSCVAAAIWSRDVWSDVKLAAATTAVSLCIALGQHFPAEVFSGVIATVSAAAGGIGRVVKRVSGMAALAPVAAGSKDAAAATGAASAPTPDASASGKKPGDSDTGSAVRNSSGSVESSTPIPDGLDKEGVEDRDSDYPRALLSQVPREERHIARAYGNRLRDYLITCGQVWLDDDCLARVGIDKLAEDCARWQKRHPPHVTGRAVQAYLNAVLRDEQARFEISLKKAKEERLSRRAEELAAAMSSKSLQLLGGPGARSAPTWDAIVYERPPNRAMSGFGTANPMHGASVAWAGKLTASASPRRDGPGMAWLDGRATIKAVGRPDVCWPDAVGMWVAGQPHGRITFYEHEIDSGASFQLGHIEYRAGKAGVVSALSEVTPAVAGAHLDLEKQEAKACSVLARYLPPGGEAFVQA